MTLWWSHKEERLLVLLVGCILVMITHQTMATAATKKMSSAILSLERLPQMHWKTFDPFLFCAYHKDQYPASLSSADSYQGMGMDPKLLRGRDLGSDFSNMNGFSMYHGEVIPGFPNHPHYG
jgi:quercetin 2,3-dioxygenase